MAEIDAEDIIEKISIENKSEEVSTENDMNESNAEDSAEEISEGNNEEEFDTEIDTAVLFDSLEGEIENTSTDEVIVAVIDTGIDIEHSELKNNIWINMKEVEDNIDNDLNLYIDDINGYNFVDENNVVCNAEWGNDMAHATHIAGIIAGKSDANEELKKIGANIKIMPLRVFSGGKAKTSKIIEAIEYAKGMNVDIINCSFGSGENNPALKDVIENSPDILFVCASGNGRNNLDKTPIYPAAYDLPNVISVTSANNDGGLSYFSNYGKETIDIAASGKEIDSTLPYDSRGRFTGTSVSAAVGERRSCFNKIKKSGLYCQRH